MAPPPMIEVTWMTPSRPRLWNSTTLPASMAAASVCSIRVPWGSQKSIMNWGRVEFGKKLLLDVAEAPRRRPRRAATHDSDGRGSARRMQARRNAAVGGCRRRRRTGPPASPLALGRLQEHHARVAGVTVTAVTHESISEMNTTWKSERQNSPVPSSWEVPMAREGQHGDHRRAEQRHGGLRPPPRRRRASGVHAPSAGCVPACRRRPRSRCRPACRER